MIPEDVITSMKNALDRGESLESAMNSLVRSGYNPRDIEEASRFFGRTANDLRRLRPEDHFILPNQKQIFKPIMQPFLANPAPEKINSQKINSIPNPNVQSREQQINPQLNQQSYQQSNMQVNGSIQQMIPNNQTNQNNQNIPIANSPRPVANYQKLPETNRQVQSMPMQNQVQGIRQSPQNFQNPNQNINPNPQMQNYIQTSQKYQQPGFRPMPQVPSPLNNQNNQNNPIVNSSRPLPTYQRLPETNRQVQSMPMQNQVQGIRQSPQNFQNPNQNINPNPQMQNYIQTSQKYQQPGFRPMPQVPSPLNNQNNQNNPIANSPRPLPTYQRLPETNMQVQSMPMQNQVNLVSKEQELLVPSPPKAPVQQSPINSLFQEKTNKDLKSSLQDLPSIEQPPLEILIENKNYESKLYEQRLKELKKSKDSLSYELERIHPPKQNRVKEIILLIILLMLVGVLISTIVFREQIIAFFS